MHKLSRGPAPACLAAYRHGLHQWSMASPSAEERAQIWQCLEQMQGRRCAYCESALKDGQRHIEHFQQRRSYPRGTFDWANLFGSCNYLDSCGKHKDTCGPYNPAHLIKPDVDDPNDYFVFVSDGTIAVKEGVSPFARLRAELTLRVFNLDAKHGRLRQMRHEAAIGYVQTAEEFLGYAEEFDEAEWRPLLEQELDAISHLPFVTAIRHVLTGSGSPTP